MSCVTISMPCNVTMMHDGRCLYASCAPFRMAQVTSHQQGQRVETAAATPRTLRTQQRTTTRRYCQLIPISVFMYPCITMLTFK